MYIRPDKWCSPLERCCGAFHDAARDGKPRNPARLQWARGRCPPREMFRHPVLSARRDGVGLHLSALSQTSSGHIDVGTVSPWNAATPRRLARRHVPLQAPCELCQPGLPPSDGSGPQRRRREVALADASGSALLTRRAALCAMRCARSSGPQRRRRKVALEHELSVADGPRVLRPIRQNALHVDCAAARSGRAVHLHPMVRRVEIGLRHVVPEETATKVNVYLRNRKLAPQWEDIQTHAASDTYTHNNEQLISAMLVKGQNYGRLSSLQLTGNHREDATRDEGIHALVTLAKGHQELRSWCLRPIR